MNSQIKPINLPDKDYLLSVLGELLSEQNGVGYSIEETQKENDR